MLLPVGKNSTSTSILSGIVPSIGLLKMHQWTLMSVSYSQYFLTALSYQL